MRSFAIATLFALLASPASPQNPNPPVGGPGLGQGRFQPPPDHWMTFDSLSQALSLSADQRTKITPAYTALNGVMKDAAARRLAIRQQMQASGGFTPGRQPTPSQSATLYYLRTASDGRLAAADQSNDALRTTLTH